MSEHTSKSWSIEDELIVGQFSEADARLIADASEIVEVLSLCVTAMKTGLVDLNPHDEYVMERATKLIEKHRGDQG